MSATISLCMIVKNEAVNLPECLHSVRDVVDEAIVVDTGSEDGTEAIARRFGTRVVRFPWRNDFAAARNAGLEHASSGWILYLDADERLDPAHKLKLRACAQLEQFDGFYLQLHNHFDNGSEGIHPLVRMFKNRREHRFEGRLHEQAVPSIYRHNPAAIFPLTDIKIHHYGYMHEVVREKDKNRRNLTILQQMLVEKPGDPFTLFNIGVEYMQLPDLEKALFAFRQARSKEDPHTASGYSGLLVKHEIKCLLLLGRLEGAIRTCDEAIEVFPRYTDLFQLKGFCLMNVGKPKEAETALLRALDLGPPPPEYHTELGIGTYQTCFMLGLLHESLRNYKKAVEWYTAAVRHNPNVLPPLFRLLRISTCMENNTWIGDFVKGNIKSDTFDALTNGMGKCDALHVIEEWLKSAETVAVYKTIIRSLAKCADHHLKTLISSPSASDYRELLQHIRLALPYEDGF
ncbi:MAG: glycosyltransferase [Paenibacillaceae bacterium]|nr:glycosyltransferase [Paenibacillaceae bacterium]